MTVVEHLYRLGGIAERAVLVALTSRRRLDNAIAAGDVLLVARGRCALPTAHHAMRRAVSVHGVVSHRSAAAWWGWELKVQPPVPEVTVRKGTRVSGSRIGLHVTDLPPDDLRDMVTSPARTVVDCLRSLPEDEGWAIADSALRHGAFTPSGLVALAANVRGPGAPRVRRAAAAARVVAANPFESVLRWLAREAGLDVEPQIQVRHGANVVRPDLVDVERRIVLEADSFAWHGNRTALRRDCRRYNWLVRHGWTVLRFSYDDVMRDPAYVLDLLRALVRAPVHADGPASGQRPMPRPGRWRSRSRAAPAPPARPRSRGGRRRVPLRVVRLELLLAGRAHRLTRARLEAQRLTAWTRVSCRKASHM